MDPIRQRPWLGWLALWLLCAIAQALHFHGYYDQPLGRSIRWALVDWGVWLGLMVAIVRIPDRLGALRWPGLVLMAPLAGLAQVVLSTCVHALFEAPSRPFLDDVVHLLDKRWLQNLLVFAVLYVALKAIMARDRQPADERRIRINDGSRIHWLASEAIRYVEAAGNYICVHTEDERIITREPLKRFQQRLDDDRFLRISRSCLVNRAFIECCQRIDRSRVEVQLTGGETAAIGRTYWPKVREALQA